MSFGGLPVLIYHHVGPLVAGTHRSLTVLPDNFAAQIDWLARHGFQPMTLAQTLDWWNRDAALPPKALLLTFDDGYADLARWAFPVLESHGFPATVFVVSDRLGQTNTWDEASGSATHRLLDAETLKRAAAIEVGAHTRSHAWLEDMSTEEIEHEVVGSKDALETALSRPVRAFAYPYGSASPAAKAVAALHFDLAFSAHEGLNHRETDRYAGRRTMVQHNETWLDLYSRLRMGYSPVHRGRVRLGAIRREIISAARSRG